MRAIMKVTLHIVWVIAMSDETITLLQWRTVQHQILCQPRSLKQSSTTACTLICSQAVICLQCKNLWSNVISYNNSLGQLCTAQQSVYYALLDLVEGWHAIRNGAENLCSIRSIRDKVATWVSEYSVQNNSIGYFTSKYCQYMSVELSQYDISATLTDIYRHGNALVKF